LESPPEDTLENLDREIIACRMCPRLTQWCAAVAQEKRKSFQDWQYWGKPVPNFSDHAADRLIVGLAPAAHGANRTGRMFTGDRSGDWLYRALYKAGVANQPTAEHPQDGLELRGVLISASAHCAPPDNKPLPEELTNCRAFLKRALDARPWKSILCLGGLAWNNVLRTLGEHTRPPFGHGTVFTSETGLALVGCYHPSQQNTFTGRLTEQMLDEAIQIFLSAGGTDRA
jgi:uracil-DNA glycosylase family 4